MAFVKDYSGRTVDLFTFQGAKPTGDQLITPSFGTKGSVTAGVQKLSQTFALLFLTETGSIPLYPERGTNFLAAMRLGRIQDEQAVQGEFVLAVDVVRRFLALKSESVDQPDDEIFESAVLNRFQLDKLNSTLRLYVKITSAAGTTHDVLLPIPVLPR